MSLGKNIRRVRKSKGWSLQALASRSGVSRSMLSMIERKEKNPTVQVAKQIAGALDVSLSQLLDEDEKPVYNLTKKDMRLVYRDDKTGFERQLLSMARGVELVFNILPKGETAGSFPPFKKGVIEHVIVTKGELEAKFQEHSIELKEGDALCFDADVPHFFRNIGSDVCTYYLVVDSNAMYL